VTILSYLSYILNAIYIIIMILVGINGCSLRSEENLEMVSEYYIYCFYYNILFVVIFLLTFVCILHR
jgi:hypothetical protein